jgi:hypothetical protein
LKAFFKTLVKLVYPDPTRDAEVETILEEIKNPRKWTDWLCLGIPCLAVAALIGFWPV